MNRLTLAALLLAVTAARAADPFPPPKSLDGIARDPRPIQRTMRLLATSTPEHRHTVRILFYGQSITEQAWWKIVADDLRRRFPHADLVIENRALGGHSSQLLVKTAEADLPAFRPDLVIFHVYGAHDRYEDVLRLVRTRTTAEILQQNDHVTHAEEMTEETDPAQLPLGGGRWSSFMNHNWLPLLSRRYGTTLCDQRATWKQYLKDYHLQPSALLRDAVHLNPRGEFLMAECVKACLKNDPSLGPSPAESWVKTHTVGKDVAWKDGTLTLPFDGGRVEAVVRPGGGPTAEVRIDGRKPSETVACYSFTRTSPFPGLNWPCLLRVGSQAPLVAEDWTLTLRDVSADGKQGRFTLHGSVTGNDGEGDFATRFVSKSGRVTIDPADWNLAFGARVRPHKIPDGFRVTWKSFLLGTDTLASRDTKPGTEATVTLVQGLPRGPHTLELRGGPDVPLAALRVYTPPGTPGAGQGGASRP